MRALFENRTCSGFGISIGTGNALRALFNTTAEVYDDVQVIEKVSLTKFNSFTVNWYTIIRNIVSSVDIDTKNKILAGKYISDLVDVALEEIALIKHLTEDSGLKFNLIAPRYLYVEKSFILKDDDSSDKMRIYRLADTIKRKIPYDHIKEYKFNIGENALLLSHINFDMLNKRNSNMMILESHSGKVLTSNMFNKKYRTKDDISFLPFYSNLIFALGDDSGLVKGFTPKIKRIIIDKLSKARITTKSSYHSIQTILSRDTNVQDFIKRFSDPY